jgi:hypothetical protein
MGGRLRMEIKQEFFDKYEGKLSSVMANEIWEWVEAELVRVYDRGYLDGLTRILAKSAEFKRGK